MRRKGVLDARKDQSAGVKIGKKDTQYEKGKDIDGHHIAPVSDNKDLMSDPRNIEFVEHKEHVLYHQNNK